MKRPPRGAEKKSKDYLSFCPLSLCLSLSLPLYLPLFLVSPLKSISSGRQLSSAPVSFSKETQVGAPFFFFLFAGGNRRRGAMRHSCDGCHCGTALAIPLPSSSFIIHAVIYFNKWRGACSSLARPRWHRRRSLSQSVPLCVLY